jgi:hypothetical protein
MGRRIPIVALGLAAVAYSYVWYSSPDYDGMAYVELPNVGFVEFNNDNDYASVVTDLSSEDPDKVQSAITIIEDAARKQGLIELTEPAGE